MIGVIGGAEGGVCMVIECLDRKAEASAGEGVDEVEDSEDVTGGFGEERETEEEGASPTDERSFSLRRFFFSFLSSFFSSEETVSTFFTSSRSCLRFLFLSSVSAAAYGQGYEACGCIK